MSLSLQTAGVASQAAITGNHSMAGQNDRHGIVTKRLTNGASGTWALYRVSDVAVRARLASRDFIDGR